MARTGVTKRYFNFVGGKHTDGSALAPPENTARTLINVDLDPNGKISRRLGLEFEDNFEVAGGPFTVDEIRNSAVSMHEWFNVANSPTAHFLVIRVGHKLHFFNQGAIPLSSGIFGTVDISGAVQDSDIAKIAPIEVTSARGNLFICGEGYNPIFISYDPGEDTFTVTAIRLLIRDTAGIDDQLGVNERPSALSQAHAYNLMNQGWSVNRINQFRNEQGAYPSNADIEHLGFRVDPSSGAKVWDSNEIINTDLGGSPAAKGHFVLDAFEENRTKVFEQNDGISAGATFIPYNVSGYYGSGFINTSSSFIQTSLVDAEPLIPVGGTNVRPKAVAFFAGRIWYASVKGKVYFSQIAESEDIVGKCYQSQDPTAEDFNELVDTDGGVILLPESGDIVKLLPLGRGLLVFAVQGIWYISGGETNFTANSSDVTKISNVKVVNGQSVIEGEGVVFFWSEEGIFAISPDQVSGIPTANSLSNARIQRDYDALPVAAKNSCQAAYDRVAKKVYWSYDDGKSDAVNSFKSRFNAMIVFDVNLNAFYDYRISDSGPSLFQPFFAGAIKRTAVNSVSETQQVVAGNDVVLDSNGDVVVTDITTDQANNSPIVMTCFYPVSETSQDFQFTFGEFTSRTFHDWPSTPIYEVNYQSIVETNPETLNEGMLDKQATWLYSYYDFQRDGFGRPEFAPRFEVLDRIRATQSGIEVIRRGAPEFRGTQSGVEVIRRGQPDFRASQSGVEIVRKVS